MSSEPVHIERTTEPAEPERALTSSPVRVEDTVVTEPMEVEAAPTAVLARVKTQEASGADAVREVAGETAIAAETEPQGAESILKEREVEEQRKSPSAEDLPDKSPSYHPASMTEGVDLSVQIIDVPGVAGGQAMKLFWQSLLLRPIRWMKCWEELQQELLSQVLDQPMPGLKRGSQLKQVHLPCRKVLKETSSSTSTVHS